MGLEMPSPVRESNVAEERQGAAVKVDETTQLPPNYRPLRMGAAGGWVSLLPSRLASRDGRTRASMKRSSVLVIPPCVRLPLLTKRDFCGDNDHISMRTCREARGRESGCFHPFPEKGETMKPLDQFTDNDEIAFEVRLGRVKDSRGRHRAGQRRDYRYRGGMPPPATVPDAAVTR